MYRQILLDERDLDFQHILWKSNPSSDTRDFQLLTVTYGTACAPFLALHVIKQLAIDEGPQYPNAASILQQNIYVDNVLFGHDNHNVLHQIREQLVSLLRRGEGGSNCENERATRKHF